MKRRERTVIYSILGLLILSNITILTGASSAAFAHFERLLAPLGPATSLTLVDDSATAGTEDATPAKDVVLRNKDGAIAFGDSAAHRIYSLGFVDDRVIIDQLMKSEALNTRRDTLRIELQAKAKEYQDELASIEEQASRIDPQDNQEGIAQMHQMWTQLQEEFQAWQQTARARGNELEANALAESYREMVAAVDVISDRLGVDLVLRSIPTNDEFTTKDPQTVSVSIRMRTAVKMPEGIDITEAVMDELGLKPE